jgi:esterase
MLKKTILSASRCVTRRTYAVDLNFVKIPNTSVKGPSRLPPLVIIHGLFGSGSNFTTVAKQLEQDVYLLDMRNHGASPHDPNMNFDAMSDDLERFLDKNDLRFVDLLGFSLGGKISMTAALRNPEKMEGLVRKLIIGDISPAPILNPAHWDIPMVLHGLMQVDKMVETMENRTEADEVLKNAGVGNQMVRNFLLSNLIRVSNTGSHRFKWRFNLHALHNNVPILASFPYKPLRELTPNPGGIETNNQFSNPTLFIKGERSNLILDEHKSTIDTFFPENQITVFKDCGHWVHTDNPKLFYETVTKFLHE